MGWQDLKAAVVENTAATARSITGKMRALERKPKTATLTGRVRGLPRQATPDDADPFALTTHHIEDEDEAAPWEATVGGVEDDARDVLLSRLDRGGFKLPLMPSTVRQAIELTYDPSSSFMGLSGLIETDPPLTGELLKLANSPLFGGMSRVGSLKQALIRIGLDGIRELLLVAAAARVLVVPGNRRLTERLQQRSLAVGLTTHAIDRRRQKSRDDDAFTAGVLHDVGLAVAWQLIKDCRRELPPEFAADVHAQQRLAQACHQAVATRLAESWRLPPETARALDRHHDPDPFDPNHRFARAVGAAIHIVDELGIYPEAPNGPSAIAQPVVRAHGLSQADIDEIGRMVTHRMGIER